MSITKTVSEAPTTPTTLNAVKRAAAPANAATMNATNSPKDSARRWPATTVSHESSDMMPIYPIAVEEPIPSSMSPLPSGP